MDIRVAELQIAADGGNPAATGFRHGAALGRRPRRSVKTPLPLSWAFGINRGPRHLQLTIEAETNIDWPKARGRAV